MVKRLGRQAVQVKMRQAKLAEHDELAASLRAEEAALKLALMTTRVADPDAANARLREIGEQLRHKDGGTLVRELYGHPDAAIARERIRAAFRDSATVVALPVSHAASHDGAQTAR